MPHDIARTRAPARVLPRVLARVLARAPASASARARVAAVAGALAFAASAVGPPASAQQRLLPVPSVDPKRYAGTWYEVARLPNRFQSQCAGDVVARYAPREDGSIDVTNRRRTASPSGWCAAKRIPNFRMCRLASDSPITRSARA